MIPPDDTLADARSERQADGEAAGMEVIPAGEIAPDEPSEGEPQIPSMLPVLPVREHVAFPGTVMPLNVGREKSKKVLDLALASDKMIGVFAQRSSAVEDPKLDDLYRIGTACRILKMFKLPDGSETIIVHGIARVGIETITQESPYLEAKVNVRTDPTESNTVIEALVHNIREAANRVMDLSPNVPDEAKVVLSNISAPGGLADFLAANLSLSLVYRQELLETFDITDRLRKVYAALTSQLEVLELSSKLHDQVREQMDQSQREYYLREQLKAIQAELGQGDARTSEVERLKEQIEKAGMPEAARKAADREMQRMAVIPQASPEYSIALDYVEWLTSLPWTEHTEDNLDLKRAEDILNADHYGLERIKRRILEFLAVRKLKPDGRGSILCFAGPPGVGKTSLGRSIARALDRKFIRMSLGGMRDEAEIRGHRRTYIGAMPGRIMQEMKKCGANNPVFMLDEVDKVGTDFRGDPASALLEVLDPQQNDTFTDHYLDVPFDLSHVLFIATANYMGTVPPPLRDRMEVIGLSSYTHREKLQIAKQYLVPRQLEENGLSTEHITFSDKALEEIIAGYTREAGVRELERQIGAVCRAQAARIVRSESDRMKVTPHTVAADLGAVKYVSELAAREVLPGVATGLAYTPVGGEILFVEASRMPGRGGLSLTGQIGDVMRESAQAAFSIVRSRSRKLHIDPASIANSDLHVHIPAGAVPKDGPSAGIAMLAAIVSAVTDKAIDPKTAMTGEITLRGAVLPVGGIKEKFLAAHRAGINRIILPEPNMKDIEEIPAEVRDSLTFVPIKTVDQLLKQAFIKPKRNGSVVKRKKSTETEPEVPPDKKPDRPKKRRKKTASRKSKSKAVSAAQTKARRKPGAKKKTGTGKKKSSKATGAKSVKRKKSTGKGKKGTRREG